MLIILLSLFGLAVCSECYGKVFNGVCYWVPCRGFVDKCDEICFNDGGRLVSIHSSEENQFILDGFMSDFTTNCIHVWTGLRIPDDSSLPFWRDGTPVDYTYRYNLELYKGKDAYLVYCTSWNGRVDWGFTSYQSQKMECLCKGRHNYFDPIDCSTEPTENDAVVQSAVTKHTQTENTFLVQSNVRARRKEGTLNILTTEKLDTTKFGQMTNCSGQMLPAGDPIYEKVAYDCHDEFTGVFDAYSDPNVKITFTGTKIEAERDIWVNSLDLETCQLRTYPARVRMEFIVVNMPLGLTKDETSPNAASFPISGIEYQVVGQISHEDRRLEIHARLFVLDGVEISALSYHSGTIEFTIEHDENKKVNPDDGKEYYDIIVTTKTKCPNFLCDSNYTVNVEVVENGMTLSYEYSFRLNYKYLDPDPPLPPGEIDVETKTYSKETFADEDETNEFAITKPIFVQSLGPQIQNLEFVHKNAFIGCSAVPGFVCLEFGDAKMESFGKYRELYKDYKTVDDDATSVEAVNEGMVSKVLARFKFFPNFVEESEVCCIYITSAYVLGSGRRGVNSMEEADALHLEGKSVVPVTFKGGDTMFVESCGVLSMFSVFLFLSIFSFLV